MKKLFLFLLIILFSDADAQKNNVLREYEDSLRELAPRILKATNYKDKADTNQLFLDIMRRALGENNSMYYPFDSLKSISRLVSPNKKLRIINWMLPKGDGTYHYFGFIQYYNKKKKEVELYELNDDSENVENPEMKIMHPNNWYGCLYYKLIEHNYKKKTYYTLLGWDGNNTVVTKKLIEVLTFDFNNQPTFGECMFSYENKTVRRVIFQYSAKAVMTLRYEKQNRVNNKDKTSLIVFDRLAPMSDGLEGQYEFYVPVTNSVDGYEFKEGNWIFVNDVDARNNPQPEKKKIPSKKTDKQSGDKLE